jgi:hypothetical protein
MLVLRALLDVPIADFGLRESRRTQKAGKQRRREKNAFHVCLPPSNPGEAQHLWRKTATQTCARGESVSSHGAPIASLRSPG